MSAHLQTILKRYPTALEVVNRIITKESFFAIFKQLSDNYSPTLTVSRVQGPQVERIIKQGPGNLAHLQVERNLRHSGSIGVKVGAGWSAIWLSGHADICSYLTGPWDGAGYPLTAFCSHHNKAGRRASIALATPADPGPLERLVEGDMVTTEAGAIHFECERADLPLQTRVVHHLPASWDPTTDRVTGFLDNQAASTAMLLAAQVLSHFEANAQILINDEEEGPVDKGNQGFSRAANRLLHRTPVEELPDYVIVSDGHKMEEPFDRPEVLFGKGATFAGYSSLTRGSVTPPQLLAFTREFAAELGDHGISLLEHGGYAGRSDDISAMQFTQNVSLIGYPAAYTHFDQPPLAYLSDLVNLAKSVTMLAFMAQDAGWRERYL
jgi:hypothetical protein